MNYKNQFQATCREPKDLQDLYHQLKNKLVDLQREFQAIQNSTGDSTGRSVSAVFSGGGGSSSVTNLQAGQVSVGTSPTVIGVSPSILSYVVLYRCVNASNESVGCDLTSIGAGSFTATALETSTLHYAIIPT